MIGGFLAWFDKRIAPKPEDPTAESNAPTTDQQIQARTRLALKQRDLGLYLWALERTFATLRLIDPDTVPARPRLLKRKDADG